MTTKFLAGASRYNPLSAGSLKPSAGPPRSPLASSLARPPQMRAVRCLLALLALTGVAAFGGEAEVTQEVKAVVEKVRDAFDEAANAQGMTG